jgi:hypothetical protein
MQGLDSVYDRSPWDSRPGEIGSIHPSSSPCILLEFPSWSGFNRHYILASSSSWRLTFCSPVSPHPVQFRQESRRWESCRSSPASRAPAGSGPPPLPSRSPTASTPLPSPSSSQVTDVQPTYIVQCRALD